MSSKPTVTFKTYEGKVKRGEGGDARWVTIGEFPTLELAREAGATKIVPRYIRG